MTFVRSICTSGFVVYRALFCLPGELPEVLACPPGHVHGDWPYRRAGEALAAAGRPIPPSVVRHDPDAVLRALVADLRYHAGVLEARGQLADASPFHGIATRIEESLGC